MRILIIGSISLLFVTTLISCANSNEMDLTQDTPSDCDTLNLTYTNNIEPILNVSCVDCHNSFSASGNVILDNYSEVKTQADNGRLLGSIKHDEGYVPMPLEQEKLSDCTIATIEAWINQGTKE